MAESADYSRWKAWDSAPFGVASPLERSYLRAELRDIAAPAGATMLEIGFGNGTCMAFCRDRGWDVAGVEINEVQLDDATNAGYRAYPSLDAIDPATRFDVILAFDVLEHLDEEMLRAMLTAIRARLTPDGVFLARVPNGDSPFGLSNQNGDATHRTAFTKSKVRQFAEPAGLRMTRYSGEQAPIFCGHPMWMLQRLVANPVKWLTDRIVGAIFLPTKRVPFAAQNVVFKLVRDDSEWAR